MVEIWQDIEKYEGLYQVSDLGNIKRLPHNRISPTGYPYIHKGGFLKKQFDKDKYHHVGLSKDGKHKTHKVHRLVLNAFLENPENKPFINHKNGIKTDNSLNNLEWCTPSENEIHSHKTGLKKNIRISVNAMYMKNIKAVINTQTGVLYKSTKDAAESIRMNRSTLINMLCGYRKNTTNLKYA